MAHPPFGKSPLYGIKLMPSITFRINTTTSNQYAIQDFGTAMMGHGLRSGVFGQRTLTDLLAFQGTHIRCDPKYAKLPIFRARRPKGNGLHGTRSMRDKSANQ